MPSAPDWLREKWGGEDGVGEDKAFNFLKEKGWKEVDGKIGFMMPPGDKISSDEHEAMLFLESEWDWACANNKVIIVPDSDGKDAPKYDR